MNFFKHSCNLNTLTSSYLHVIYSEHQGLTDCHVGKNPIFAVTQSLILTKFNKS